MVFYKKMALVNKRGIAFEHKESIKPLFCRMMHNPGTNQHTFRRQQEAGSQGSDPWIPVWELPPPLTT